MIRATDVIEDARDQHPTFDKNTHPDRVLLRQLSAYQRELIGKALIRYPDLFSEDLDISLPIVDFAAGVALDNPLMIHDAEGLTSTGRTFTVAIISSEDRHGPRPLRAVYVLNRRLYQAGNEMDWSGAASIRLKFSKTVPALSALDDVLTLPDEASQPMAAKLALTMALRGSQRRDVTQASVQVFHELWKGAEDDFLRGLWLQRSATSSVRREVC